MSLNPDELSGAQFLTFTLRAETFAVPVAQAREILDSVPLTWVPQMPDFVAGVINLRGRVVPVIDLRRRFGFAGAQVTRDSCTIILEIEVDGSRMEFGAMVDGVQEVLALSAGQIEPPPRLGLGMHGDLLAGIGKQGDRFIILLRPERLIAEGEVPQLAGLLAPVQAAARVEG